LNCGGFGRSAPAVLDVDVIQLDVFDRVAGNAAKDRAQLRIGIRADQIADQHAAQRTDRHASGTAHAAAEAQEDGCRGNVAHGDVGDGDVFQQRAVDGFESESLTGFEDAVGNCDVLEGAVRFGAELDAAGAGVAGIEASECAVEQRARFVDAGHVAVGDGDVFRGAGVTEGKGTLGADGVVPRRIDAAVRHADIAAAVDVDAVAVGIDFQVVDGEVVDAGGENAEVSSLED